MHASPLCVDLNYLASEKTINFLLSRIVGGLGKEASRAPETSRGAPRNHLSHRRAWEDQRKRHKRTKWGVTVRVFLNHIFFGLSLLKCTQCYVFMESGIFLGSVEFYLNFGFTHIHRCVLVLYTQSGIQTHDLCNSREVSYQLHVDHQDFSRDKKY